jgi:hypothetical protein
MLLIKELICVCSLWKSFTLAQKGNYAEFNYASGRHQKKKSYYYQRSTILAPYENLPYNSKD